MQNIWVIAPFDYENPEIWQRVWESNLSEGFISLGWRALKDVSKLTTEQIYKLHRKTYTYSEATKRGAMADAKVLIKFWHDIAVGHTIVARRGRKSIAAIGTVTSAPYYQPSKAKSSFVPEPAYPNHIDVEWQDEFQDLNFPTQVFGMQALHALPTEKLQILLKQSSVVTTSIYPDELVSDRDYVEGGRKTIVVNTYERSPSARAACLRVHGYRCAACEMLFADTYGEIGINFIHVHHTKPIAARSKQYSIDPVKDLIPICPNCHAMLHSQQPPLTINKLRQIISQNNAQ